MKFFSIRPDLRLGLTALLSLSIAISANCAALAEEGKTPVDNKVTSPDNKTSLTDTRTVAENSRDKALERGIAAAKAGRFDEAEAAFQECLKISQGKEFTTADIALSLHCLIKINLDQHKWVEAEPLIQKVLAVDENQLKDEHAVAFDLDALAIVCLSLDKYKEALTAMQRKMAIDEKTGSAADSLRAENYLKMGMIYDKAKMLPESEAALRKSLEIRDKSGDQSSDLVTNLMGLGAVCLEEEKYSDAMPFLNRVLTMKEKELGPDSADLARVMTKLKTVYEKTGDQKMADQMSKRLGLLKPAAAAAEPAVTK